MRAELKDKLKQLPTNPGVYFHKSNTGEIIYVGKAANLRNRVRQYFQKSRLRDIKTDALVAEIIDTDWIDVETEIDALFLESEMIKRYQPRYNVLLRDDKSQIYVRIPMNEAYPAVSYTRGPLDDNALYFGPYYNGWAVRKALRYLRRVFPYSTHETMPKRLCLQYHIGLCPGVEAQKISSTDYKKILHKLIRYLKGERKVLVRELEREMLKYAKNQQFEEAAKIRNRLKNMKELQRQIVFGDREFMDISKDHALIGLQELLGLQDVPRRIEGYDISHMSGTNNVASMVVATNGLADKNQYRKFKMQLPGNNDFEHMRETMRRRFSGKHNDWPMPDLILIDGGKGQLGAALGVLEGLDIKTPVIGLAKREEQVVVHRERSNVRLSDTLTHSDELDGYILINLPKTGHVSKLLQRIRNESHRFAVSYHTTLKRKAATKSLLDEIPGVGAATRRKLLTSFVSTRAVAEADQTQLTAVIGEKKAKLVYNWFHPKSM